MTESNNCWVRLDGGLSVERFGNINLEVSMGEARRTAERNTRNRNIQILSHSREIPTKKMCFQFLTHKQCRIQFAGEEFFDLFLTSKPVLSSKTYSKSHV